MLYVIKPKVNRNDCDPEESKKMQSDSLYKLCPKKVEEVKAFI